MTTFIFQYLRNSILPFKMPLTIIILFTIIVASYTSNGQISQETNERYLITSRIKGRKLLIGSARPSEIISSNKYGGRIRVYTPPMFTHIELEDYKMYRIEHRLVGRILFSTNMPVSNIVVIVNYMADTEPDGKPCIIFAEPYSLPNDVVQKYNLQGAKILQVKGGIFKEGPTYYASLNEYGIKPEVILTAQVTLKPEALEVNPGILTAFVRLPEGYPVSGITSATCDGAFYERMMPNEDGTEMIINSGEKILKKPWRRSGKALTLTLLCAASGVVPRKPISFMARTASRRLSEQKRKRNRYQVYRACCPKRLLRNGKH